MHVPASENDVGGASVADEPRQEPGDAGVWRQPAANIARRDRCAGTHHAKITRESETKARTGGRSVHRRDHRFLTGGDRLHPAPDPVVRIQPRRAIGRFDPPLFAKIETGAESPPCPGDHDHADRVVVCRLRHGQGEFFGEPWIHGIEPFGAIQRDRPHPGCRRIDQQMLERIGVSCHGSRIQAGPTSRVALVSIHVSVFTHPLPPIWVRSLNHTGTCPIRLSGAPTRWPLLPPPCLPPALLLPR